MSLPDLDAVVAKALDSRYDLGRARNDVQNAATGVEFLSNQKLPDGLTPRWYAIGCAVYDVYVGALCYLPILRR